MHRLRAEVREPRPVALQGKRAESDTHAEVLLTPRAFGCASCVMRSRRVLAFGTAMRNILPQLVVRHNIIKKLCRMGSVTVICA